MKRFATSVAALLVCCTLSFAQETQPSQQASGKIKSLAENQLTLTTTDGDQTFQLSNEKDSQTLIVLGGKKSAASSLKENQQITICYTKASGDKQQARIISDKASQVRGKIKSVSDDTKQVTVTDTDDKQHQFQVQQPPTMLVASNGKQSQPTDLKANQQVMVIYMQSEGKNVALEIRQQK